MVRYVVLRLLQLPLTLFMVAMILFLVLNLAPGTPAPEGAGSEQGNRAGQRESQRAFREQFRLDRPILLNTRPWVSVAQVQSWLDQAYQLNGEVDTAELVLARRRLDDYGNSIVRHLVAMLDDPKRSSAAVDTLTRAGQLRIESGVDASVRREILQQNRIVAGWGSARDAEHWRAFYSRNREVFEPSVFAAVYTLLFQTRFATWCAHLGRLDFGRSLVNRRPVLETIASRVPYTLTLTGVSLAVAYLIAVPLGVFGAANRGSMADLVLTVIIFILFALPAFFSGTVLLRFFSEGEPFAWFPPGGLRSLDFEDMTTGQQFLDVVWHLVLPVVTYASAILAVLSRYARTGVIEVIQADYVRTARAKGLSEFVVIVKHAARNGMIPILTLVGSLLPVLVSGSVVIEVVFNIPGMGLYLFDSISQRDYNAVMGVLIIVSFLTVLGVFLSDLLYAAADPRVSLG